MKRTGAKQIHITEALQKDIKDVFDRYDVQFAYGFGSSLVGSIHEESDIDIAVYFDPEVSASDTARQTEQLYDPLSAVLKVPSEALDIAVLNKAPLLLKHIVATQGITVYESSHTARVDFELAVMRQRNDERFYRRHSRRVFLTRLAESSL